MITKEAAVLLRRSYVGIRFNESQGHSAYRITVRQLESLIRLSEAIARLECSIEVTEDHVKEAVRLLSSSIMKVHQPDLEIDTRGQLVEVRDDSQNGVAQPAQAVQEIPGRMIEEGRVKQKMKLQAEEYERLARMIIHMFQENERIAPDDDDHSGIPQNVIIDYVVSKNLNQLNTMEDLNKFTVILKAVIDRMVKKDGFIIIVDEGENIDSRSLKLNPTFVDPFA